MQLGVIAKKTWSSISPRFEVRGYQVSSKAEVISQAYSFCDWFSKRMMLICKRPWLAYSRRLNISDTSISKSFPATYLPKRSLVLLRLSVWL